MITLSSVIAEYEPLFENIYNIDFRAKVKENSAIVDLTRRLAAAVLGIQLIARVLPKTKELYRNWSVHKASAPTIATEWFGGIFLCLAALLP